MSDSSSRSTVKVRARPDGSTGSFYCELKVIIQLEAKKFVVLDCESNLSVPKSPLTFGNSLVLLFSTQFFSPEISSSCLGALAAHFRIIRMHASVSLASAWTVPVLCSQTQAHGHPWGCWGAKPWSHQPSMAALSCTREPASSHDDYVFFLSIFSYVCFTPHLRLAPKVPG